MKETDCSHGRVVELKKLDCSHDQVDEATAGFGRLLRRGADIEARGTGGYGRLREANGRLRSPVEPKSKARGTELWELREATGG